MSLLPTDSGAIVIGWLLAVEHCEWCGGRGWIAVDDQILDGLIDAPCPACQSTP